jgi:uncharacterized protein involved in response to NO
MKPIFVASLSLLLLTLCLSLLGTILARRHVIHVRNAKNYSRLCTLLVLGGFYALTVFDWPGLHLRKIDFWSVLLIIAIVAYALILGAITYQLGKVKQVQFGDSYMLSMLHSDDEYRPDGDFAATQLLNRKRD